MTEIEKTGGLLPLLKIELHKSLVRFKKQICSKRNFRYFLYYSLGNFAVLILYSLYEMTQQTVDLSIKPVTSPAVEGSWILFAFAVAIMPLSLLFEEFAFRLMPMVWIKDIFHLNRITISVQDENGCRVIQNGKVRFWLYHNWIWVFIVVSGLWAAWIHQLNIVESSPIGTLIYFGVQCFSGFSFAYLYARRGLGSSWVIHVSWDLFLVALNLILLLAH